MSCKLTYSTQFLQNGLFKPRTRTSRVCCCLCSVCVNRCNALFFIWHLTTLDVIGDGVPTPVNAVDSNWSRLCAYLPAQPYRNPSALTQAASQDANVASRRGPTDWMSCKKKCQQSCITAGCRWPRAQLNIKININSKVCQYS